MKPINVPETTKGLDHFRQYLAPEASLPLEGVNDNAEYIRTPDAAAFLRAVSSAGLRLSYEAEDELKQEGDRRYGNAYVWLTRSAAAWISSGREKHSGLTVFERQEEVWSDEQEDYVHPGPTDTSKLNSTGSPGADVLIHLLRQATEAQKSGDHSSDIPVTKNVKSMKRDACKDVEAYFVQAAWGYAGPNGVETVQIGDKQFWQKHLKAETFINLEQIRYNGVNLPPGCVFRKEDDGYLFLRVTGLAFDQKTAESLFGFAISNWHNMRNGSLELEYLFTSFQRDRDQIAARHTSTA